MAGAGPVEAAESTIRQDMTRASASVFISYARADSMSARSLRDHIKRLGVDVFWDRDISAAEQWDERLQREIAGRGAFVAIVTPDWVGSPECRREGDRAQELGKRIVPVHHREVANEWPPSIAAFNAIEWREPTDVGAAAAAIHSAVLVDLKWLRNHTLLTRMASDWFSQYQTTDLLLRGRVLRRAEGWLKHPPSEDPNLGELHRRFLEASRQERRRRWRRLAIAVILVVAVVVALLLWQQSTDREREGEERLALTQQLASDAVDLVDRDEWELAALLAREVYELNRRSDGDAAEDADRALRTVLSSDHRSRDLMLEDVATVAVSTASDVVVGVTDEVPWVRRLDGARTKQPVHGPEGRVRVVAVSPDGRSIAVGGEGGLVVSRLGADAVIEVARVDLAVGWSVAFSEDGSRLVVSTPEGEVHVWRPTSSAPPAKLDSPVCPARPVAFDHGGDRVVAGTHDGHVLVWALPDTSSPTVMRPHSDWVESVAFTRDGSAVLSGGRDERLRRTPSTTRRHRSCSASTIARSQPSPFIPTGAASPRAAIGRCGSSTSPGPTTRR